jgi:hypothetical protein
MPVSSSLVPSKGNHFPGTSSPVPSPYKGEPGTGTTSRPARGNHSRRRESIDEKANRLLVEHRVWLETVAGPLVRALVQGDHGSWLVEHQSYGWRCSCPYPYRTTRQCSHVKAVQRVTTRPT